MKKILFAGLAITLLSCSSELERSIVITEYGTTIESIREYNNNYSKDDYSTASKKFNQLSFTAMQSGVMKLDITYNELLEESKKINQDFINDLDTYEDELKELKDAVNLEIIKGVYSNLSSYMPEDPHGYAVEIKIKNKTDKIITALKGKVELLNENNELLLTYSMQENLTLEAQKSVEGTDTAFINGDENILEIKSLPLSKFTQEWYPELIIYDDGTRMKAPKKPIHPYL